MVFFEKKQIYKNGTAIRSVYDQITQMEIGETRILESFDSFTGERLSHQRTRMFASKVCKEHGMNIKTRIENDDLYAVRRL